MHAALCGSGGGALGRVGEPESALSAQAGALEVCKAAVTTRFPQHEGVRRAAKNAMDSFTKVRADIGADIGVDLGAGTQDSQHEVGGLL